MSEAIEAQLKQATAAHADAIARTKALHEQARQARQEAIQAASMGELLLVQTATGEAEADDDQLIAADDAAKQAERTARIADAKHAASVLQQHRSQVELLRSQADALQVDYDGAVSRLIEFSELVDERLADLQDAVSAYLEQQKAVELAHQAAHAHNEHAISYGHTRNPLLKDAHPDQQPRVHRIPHQLGFIKLRAGLFRKTGDAGLDNSMARTQIHALAPRTRADFNRPVGA